MSAVGARPLGDINRLGDGVAQPLTAIKTQVPCPEIAVPSVALGTFLLSGYYVFEFFQVVEYLLLMS